jgi:hypothetical protein
VKVDIHLPRPFEAVVEYDEEVGRVTLRPAFVDAGPRTLAFLVVNGEKGRERRYHLRVSGQSGRVSLVEARESPCRFDTLGPGDAAPDDDGGDP